MYFCIHNCAFYFWKTSGGKMMIDEPYSKVKVSIPGVSNKLGE